MNNYNQEECNSQTFSLSFFIYILLNIILLHTAVNVLLEDKVPSFELENALYS